MARVSKKSLENSHLNALFKQLNSILSRLNERQADKFLTELLGNEERIMLAKRLAAIVMLHNRHTQYRIAQALKISTGTASTLHERYQAGHYQTIISLLKKEPLAFADLITTLDTILHLGFLPRYNSTDRSQMIKRTR